MSKPPKPGNEMKAQVRRYRTQLVRGPHPYVWPVGKDGNGLRACARRQRQIARVRHPTRIESMVKPWVDSETETLP